MIIENESRLLSEVDHTTVTDEALAAKESGHNRDFME